MRKWMSVFFSVLFVLVASSVSYASEHQSLPHAVEEGSVLEVFDGASLDLDGDGTVETIAFEVNTTDNLEEGTYSLRVNGSEATGNGFGLTGQLHAIRLFGDPNAYLLVSEIGPSDVFTCYVYCYSDGKISFAGSVETSPDEIYVSGAQFTGKVRGNVLQTWYRPADFIIAYGFDSDEYQVVEVPRAIYPMGSIVTTKMEIPLRVSPHKPNDTLAVKKGEKVILAATDDSEWLYVAFTNDHNQEDTYFGGWLRLDDYSVFVGNKLYDGSDVFDGLLFAG